MLNDRFYKWGFQEGHQSDLAQSETQYYPQTAEYYLSETELMEMSQTDLRQVKLV